MTTSRTKTILITGASSRARCRDGAAVRREGLRPGSVRPTSDRLEGLRAEIAAANPGRRVEIRALDVNDDEQVFEVFRAFRADFGTIDRVVVNAGLGKGPRSGTGGHAANKQTAMTNFVAALTQSEAAMEIFRAQNAGHFVMISSMSAMRGLPEVDDDVRRHQGRGRPPGGGPAQRTPRQADRGHA